MGMFGKAHRTFLGAFPNYDAVPCSDAPGTCCFGTGLCSAIGHDGCCPAHKRNPFGEAVGEARLGDEAVWTLDLVKGDPDGDGRSSGDEMGDPCGEFDGTPGSIREKWDVSHPGEKSSTTRRASCSLVHPSDPSSVEAARTTDGDDVVVFGLGMDRSDSCWCSRDVGGVSQLYRSVWTDASTAPPSATDMSGSDPTSTWAALDGVRLCSFPGSTSSISIIFHNLLGDSNEVNITISGGATKRARADKFAAKLPCAKSDQPWKVQVPTRGPIIPGLAGLAGQAFVGGVVMVVIGGWLIAGLVSRKGVRMLGPRRRWIRREFILQCISPGFGREKCPTNCLARCGLRGTSSNIGMGTSLHLAGAAVVTGLYTLPGLEPLLYPYDHATPFGRVFGVATLGLVLTVALASTKLFGGPMLGLAAPDRAIVVHRWIGAATVLGVTIHALAMTITISESKLPLDFLVTWNTDWNINVGAGLGAGVVLYIIALSSQIRRFSYALFWFIHMLAFPSLLILTLLHLHKSSVGVTGYVVTAAVVVIVDFLLAYVLPTLFFKTRVVSAQVVVSEEDAPGGRGITKLVIVRTPRSTNSFLPYLVAPIVAGRHVHLLAPGISLVGHPFSVAKLSTATPSTTTTPPTPIPSIGAPRRRRKSHGDSERDLGSVGVGGDDDVPESPTAAPPTPIPPSPTPLLVADAHDVNRVSAELEAEAWAEGDDCSCGKSPSVLSPQRFEVLVRAESTSLRPWTRQLLRSTTVASSSTKGETITANPLESGGGGGGGRGGGGGGAIASGAVAPSVMATTTTSVIPPSLQTVFSFAPWGRPHHVPLASYDHIVLVAGGIGITPLVAAVQRRLWRHRKEADDVLPAKDTPTPTTTLAWSCRELQLAHHVLHDLLPIQDDTSSDGDGDLDGEVGTTVAKRVKSINTNHPGLAVELYIPRAAADEAPLPIHRDRLDPAEIIRNAVHRAVLGRGGEEGEEGRGEKEEENPQEILVVVCGPTSLENAVFDSVIAFNKQPKDSKPNAVLHSANEAFHW